MIVSDPPFQPHGTETRCHTAPAVTLDHDMDGLRFGDPVIRQLFQTLKLVLKRGLSKLQYIFFEMILGIFSDIDGVRPPQIKSCLCGTFIVYAFLFPEMSQLPATDLFIYPLTVDLLYPPVHLLAVCIDLFDLFPCLYPGQPGKGLYPVVPPDLELLVPVLVRTSPGGHPLLLHTRIAKARARDIKLDHILPVQSILRSYGMVKSHLRFRCLTVLFYPQLIKGFVTLPAQGLNDSTPDMVAQIIVSVIAQLPGLLIVLPGIKPPDDILVVSQSVLLLLCGLY